MKVYGPYKRKDGRLHVCICYEDGTKKTRSYPRLLLEQKLGRELTKEETVDHIDGDFSNNQLENLRVLSRAENASWGWKTGNCKPMKASREFKIQRSMEKVGVKNPLAKFTDKQIAELRSRKMYYGCIKIWGREFNVSPKTISNILKNVSYVM